MKENPFKKYAKELDKKREKAPPHEISATANLVEEVGLFTKSYSRTYWMGKIKRAKVSYIEMVGILKEIQSMDPKYNKGGRLTNLLTEKAKKIKQKNG